MSATESEKTAEAKTEGAKQRGRPRQFDLGEAVATAQQLFHEKGYDALSLADLTEALGIRPPSFYAAFGSKAGLYKLVLERYNGTAAVPFAELLAQPQPLVRSLSDILYSAAEVYTAGEAHRGCLVIEGMHSLDEVVSVESERLQAAAAELIRARVAQEAPQQAGVVTDYMAITLAGMSAMARRGYCRERLKAVAEAAAAALPQLLSPEGSAAR